MTKYKNGKSVRHVSDDYCYTEYDAYDRVTFYIVHKSGYWCLKFYDEPKEGQKADVVPYNAVHKWWGDYNIK